VSSSYPIGTKRRTNATATVSITPTTGRISLAELVERAVPPATDAVRARSVGPALATAIDVIGNAVALDGLRHRVVVGAI